MAHTTRRRRPSTAAGALILLMTALSSEAAAEPGAPAPTWILDIGPGLIVSPRSFGGDSLRVLPVPAFRFTYRNRFYVNPDRGIGVQGAWHNLEAHGGLGVDFTRRDATADPRLRGVKEVSVAPAFRGGASLSVSRLDLSMELSTRLGSSDRRGTQLTVDLGSARPIDFSNPRTIVGAGLFVRAADSRYAENFFAINPTDAAASGLPAFQAGSGLFGVGPRVQLLHRFSTRWALFTQLSATHLVGDAAHSPVVQRRTQMSAVLSLSYRWTAATDTDH